MTTEPRAEIILDSIAPNGKRLTTMEVTFHRFVLAEFNTHRVFSRNSASSRAIPVSKRLATVEDYPALPVEYGQNQKGMQAGEELSADLIAEAEQIILRMRDNCLDGVKELMDIGVHKQIANRYLEPWVWHTVIVTATDWDNYFEQRVSELAQPEIKLPSEMMLEVFQNSTPTELGPNEWHTPYIQPDEDMPTVSRITVSAARCARVSYLTHDGVRDISADMTLYQRLTTARPMHASPLEHVATPYLDLDHGRDTTAHLYSPAGNFEGWAQLRHNLWVTQ